MSDTMEKYREYVITSFTKAVQPITIAQARGDTNTATSLARRLRRDFPKSDQTRALAQLLNEKG